jgi:hypothetical protein
VEFPIPLTNLPKIASKTEKLAGFYCLPHVYEISLRGIISMAVPKGTAEKKISKLLGRR